MHEFAFCAIDSSAFGIISREKRGRESWKKGERKRSRLIVFGIAVHEGEYAIESAELGYE